MDILLGDLHSTDRVRIAVSGLVSNIDLHRVHRLWDVHRCVITHHVFLQARRCTQRNVWRSGKSDRCTRHGHPILRSVHAGDHAHAPVFTEFAR